MNDLNPIQMEILKELLFKPYSRFTELNKIKVSSDQFSYHLRVLLDLGYVVKSDDNATYVLSLSGKEFANRMDTVEKKIEKQPKVSVLVIPFKVVKGKRLYLVSTRKKEPYYGYKGFMTGKVRFGETVKEAGKRELFEETSLSADIKHCFVLHEMVYKKDGEILEDKFFNVVEAANAQGELVDDEGTESVWMSEREFFEATPKYHNEDEIFRWYKKGNTEFKEKKYYIESF